MSNPRITKDTVQSLADAIAGHQYGNVQLTMIQNGAQLNKATPEYSTSGEKFNGSLSTRRAAAYLLGAFNGWAWLTGQTIPEHVSHWNGQLAGDTRFHVANALYYGWRDGMNRAETYASGTGLAPAELFYVTALLHREMIHVPESKVAYLKARSTATDDSGDLVGTATVLNYSPEENRLILRRSTGTGLNIDVRQVLRVY